MKADALRVFGPGLADSVLATPGGRVVTYAILTVITATTVLMVVANPPPAAYDASDMRVGFEAFRQLSVGESLYGWDIAAPSEQPLFYHYPPITALLFGVLQTLGLPLAVLLWRIASVLALVATMGLRAGVLAVLSWPIIIDLYVCNGTAFSVASIVLAIRRPSPASFALLGVILGMAPRSPFVPLVIILVATYRRSAWPLGAGLALVTLASIPVGQVGEFVVAALSSTSEMSAPANLAPSHDLGAAWLLISVPLAIMLSMLAYRWRDRLILGMSMFVAAPYWLPTTFVYAALGLYLSITEHDRPTNGHLSGSGSHRPGEVEHSE